MRRSYRPLSHGDCVSFGVMSRYRYDVNRSGIRVRSKHSRLRIVAVTAAALLVCACAPRAVFVTDPATEVYYGGADAIERAVGESSTLTDRVTHERVEAVEGAGEALSRISERHRRSTIIVPAILRDMAHERLYDHEGIVVVVGAEPDNERFAAVTFEDGAGVEEVARKAVESYHALDRDRSDLPAENDENSGVPALFLLSDESDSAIRERSHAIYDALEESRQDEATIERRRFFTVPGDDELRRAIREAAESEAGVLIASVSRGWSVIEEESERHGLLLAAAYEVGAGGPRSDTAVAWLKRPLDEVIRVAVGLSPDDRAVVEMEVGTADR